MEALIASAILFAGVLAVISAITSGQQKAFEAEQQVMATLAAEELMGTSRRFRCLDHVQRYR
ncbi:MAG: type IV pilus modification PilV family protein [Planctomycetota bacterium]